VAAAASVADVVWAGAVSVAGVVRACAGTVADVSLVGAGTDVVGSLATGATANVAIVVGAIVSCGGVTMAMLRTWLGPTMVAGARG
jgi:hypothetical protein